MSVYECNRGSKRQSASETNARGWTNTEKRECSAGETVFSQRVTE